MVILNICFFMLQGPKSLTFGWISVKIFLQVIVRNLTILHGLPLDWRVGNSLCIWDHICSWLLTIHVRLYAQLWGYRTHLRSIIVYRLQKIAKRYEWSCYFICLLDGISKSVHSMYHSFKVSSKSKAHTWIIHQRNYE